MTGFSIMKRKKALSIGIDVLYYTLIGTASLILLTVFVWAFVADQFVIKGESMEPGLTSGDHILVNKLLMGARIYKDYDFSSPSLSCFRMPGFRNLRPGDVAVFNYPEGWEDGHIGFKINYVYCKRCIGVPGDSVSVVNGFYTSTSCENGVFAKMTYQNALSSMSDSLLVRTGYYIRALANEETGWTIRNMGPLYVPGKGDTVRLDRLSAAFYGKIIEWETGLEVRSTEEGVFVGEQLVPEYIFKDDYYFFGGDNVLNSRDSRYIGLVPGQFVTGIATRILFHKDPVTRRFRLRLKRIR